MTHQHRRRRQRGLGIAYAELGEMSRAIEYHEQVLAIDREIGDRRSEAQVLGNLGNADAGLGETGRAIELYELRLGLGGRGRLAARRGADEAAGGGVEGGRR